MTAIAADPRTTRRPGRRGPPLPVPAISYAVLTVAVFITYPGPGPTTDAGRALTIAQGAPAQAAVWALLYAGSVIPLAVWAAAAVHRLQGLGARVAGAYIALAGGILASGALLGSALAGWTASQVAPDGDAGVVHALSVLSFALGGVGFALGSGLLIAGVAVPSLILRLVPRPLAWAGLVLAALGGLSVLTLALPALSPMLPIVRFGGLLWFVAVGVLMPLDRRDVPERPA